MNNNKNNINHISKPYSLTVASNDNSFKDYYTPFKAALLFSVASLVMTPHYANSFSQIKHNVVIVDDLSQNTLQQKISSKLLDTFSSVKKELHAHSTLDTQAMLTIVNNKINTIQFKDETGDIWKSVNEFLSDSYGDCEDFVMAKYALLRMLGFEASELRLALVNTEQGDGHVILEVKKDGHFYVMDNRFNELLTKNPYKDKFFTISTEGFSFYKSF